MGIYTDRGVYRASVRSPDLVSFHLRIRETDMLVMADTDLSREAYDIVLSQRLSLEAYIREHPEFQTSLAPLEVSPVSPPLVRMMSLAAAAAGVGPMAAVAGALAQCLGEDLSSLSRSVIVENGGDVYLRSPRSRVVGIYAGRGPMELSFGLEIDAASPVGVCTSSGIIGPSYSAGTARAATVVAASAALADAAATALGNRVREPGDIEKALAWAGSIAGIIGAVAMHGKAFGAWGKINLVQL